MAYIKLIGPFHDCVPGDVIDVPAVVARDLQHKGIGHGGRIKTNNAKAVDFSVRTPEKTNTPKPENKPKTSQDYTITELRDMDLKSKPDSFFEGDKRKTVEILR